MTRSFRNALAVSLEEQLKLLPHMVVLFADSAKALRIAGLKEKYPDRFLGFGISEADMTSAAAGMAASGLLPVIVGFSMFVSERPFEQIRQHIAYPNLNVKIIATHAGLSVGQDGASHQAIEDMAILRALPNFQVLTAADITQTNAAIKTMLRQPGPAYLRLGRDLAEDVYKVEQSYKIGGSDMLRDGSDVTLIAQGLMVYEALKAAEILEYEGIDAAVINAYCLKPLDQKTIKYFAEQTGCFVTAEDHVRTGGLAGAVMEYTAQHCPVPVEWVAIDDCFGESGSQYQLYEKYGLNAENIVEKAKVAIKRKRGGL